VRETLFPCSGCRRWTGSCNRPDSFRLAHALVTRNPFLWILLYLTATVLVGALVAWPLSIALGATFDISFHRVLSRTLALTLLVNVLIFLRATGGVSRAEAGFGTNRSTLLRAVAVNFAIGLGAIAPLVVVLFATGVRGWAAGVAGDALERLAVLVPLALLTGLTIGLLEETYFRGLVMLAALRRGGVRSALVATSLFFAMLHFLVPREEPDAVRWHSGFEHVAQGLSTLSNPAAAGAFAALTAAGLLLGAMRLRDGHIGSCVGFHAGWVTGYTLTHRLTDVTDASTGLVGPDGVLGWLALAWIAALLLAYVALGRRGRPAARPTSVRDTP
jgi:membrane protease YdiL (CAAX protease family)